MNFLQLTLSGGAVRVVLATSAINLKSARWPSSRPVILQALEKKENSLLFLDPNFSKEIVTLDLLRHKRNRMINSRPSLLRVWI